MVFTDFAAVDAMQKLTAEKCRPVVDDSKLLVSSVLCALKPPREKSLQIIVSSGPIIDLDPDLWDEWRRAQEKLQLDQGYSSQCRAATRFTGCSKESSKASLAQWQQSSGRCPQLVSPRSQMVLQYIRLGWAYPHTWQQHDALIS